MKLERECVTTFYLIISSSIAKSNLQASKYMRDVKPDF